MVLTLDLPEALTNELQDRARQAGVSVTEYVAAQLQRLAPQSAADSGPETHPLLELAGRIRLESTHDGIVDLPTDFARNHDCYIHGAPRRTE